MEQTVSGLHDPSKSPFFSQVGSLKTFIRRLTVVLDGDRADLLYKTTLCSQWLVGGRCAHGVKCTFAHGQGEMRPKPARRHGDTANDEPSLRAVRLIQRAMSWALEVNELHQIEEMYATFSNMVDKVGGCKVGRSLSNELRQARCDIKDRQSRLRAEHAETTAEEMRLCRAGLSGADSQALTDAIREQVLEDGLSAAAQESHETIRRWLEQAIRDGFPGAGLCAYGSSASGLGLKGADLDLCLAVPCEEEEGGGEEGWRANPKGMNEAELLAFAKENHQAWVNFIQDNNLTAAGHDPKRHDASTLRQFWASAQEKQRAAAGDEETKRNSCRVLSRVGRLLRPMCQQYIAVRDGGFEEDMSVADTGDTSGEECTETVRNRFLDMRLVAVARVPVLTLSICGPPIGTQLPNSDDILGTEIDICTGHSLVLRNTALLRTYVAADPRVRPVLVRDTPARFSAQAVNSRYSCLLGCERDTSLPSLQYPNQRIYIDGCRSDRAGDDVCSLPSNYGRRPPAFATQRMALCRRTLGCCLASSTSSTDASHRYRLCLYERFCF